MTIEIALALLAVSAPITVAILKIRPVVASPPVVADIAAIKATLVHLQNDMREMKADIRQLRDWDDA